jgi:hypothetical protein
MAEERERERGIFNFCFIYLFSVYLIVLGIKCITLPENFYLLFRNMNVTVCEE